MEFTFVLKKVISGSIMPLSIILLILILSLILIEKRKFEKGQVAILSALILLFTISYQPFATLLLKPLESSYSKLETIPKEAKYILLLGGDLNNRGWEALRLYNKIDNGKIITSGYKGHYDIPEAIRTANIFQELGIPKEDIIIHPQPKDTKEEAIKIKKTIGDKPFILVTSAYHMPRTIALFKKEGLNPIAAPTNFLALQYNFTSFPSGKNILKTQIALHEYLGLLWSLLRGQI